jgi:exopolyphosphatase/guanosine-5'-triphosphate,3'-diphosphate pyrophosphatase
VTRRFATIDIGTNSVLLLVAERGVGGAFVPVAERMEITRLGRGVDRTRRLSEAALEATLEAVGRFAALAREFGAHEVLATATSAARDADNGHLLVDGAAALGVPVEIIAGEREARLSWRAVAGDFSPGGEPLAVVDIGGGSTEVIVGAGADYAFRHSFDVGSVRLTERHLAGDPPEPAALRSLAHAVAETFAGVPKVAPGTRVVGVAGTYTTLCAVADEVEPYDAARVHGRVLSLAELIAVADRLAALPLEARLHLAGLSPKRADVIVAGASIAVGALHALGATEVTIGDRGVRWGYLYDRFGARS